MQVGLSGYMLAAVWGGGSTNYSYPLYYDMGAAVQDHFLNWKVTSTPMHSWPDCLLTLTAAQSLISAKCLGLHSGQQSSPGQVATTTCNDAGGFGHQGDSELAAPGLH